MTKSEVKSLPRYVKILNTCMRLHNREKGLLGWNPLAVEYYRDAGCWSVGIKIIDGKPFTSDSYDYLNDVEIIPITYKEWKKSNARYIDKTTKAYKL